MANHCFCKFSSVFSKILKENTYFISLVKACYSYFVQCIIIHIILQCYRLSYRYLRATFTKGAESVHCIQLHCTKQHLVREFIFEIDKH